MDSARSLSWTGQILPAITQRQTTWPLLPRARIPERPLCAGWRARDPRRRRVPGIRRAPAEDPSGGLADRAPRGEMPARFIAFDLLALDDGCFSTSRSSDAAPSSRSSSGSRGRGRRPCARDADAAQTEWLQGAEGVIAKQLDAPYRPGERTGMVKVKRVRTIDSWSSGWRPGKEEGTLGSLILGLYDKKGELQVVGHTSGFRAKEKRELPARLAPYETGERGTGDASRWTAGPRARVDLRPARARRRGHLRPRRARGGSATARRSCAGARTRSRRPARSISSTASAACRPGRCGDAGPRQSSRPSCRRIEIESE